MHKTQGSQGFGGCPQARGIDAVVIGQEYLRFFFCVHLRPILTRRGACGNKKGVFQLSSAHSVNHKLQGALPAGLHIFSR